MATFTETLRNAVLGCGQTPYALAEALDLDASTLGRFAKGERGMSLESSMKLGIHLGVWHEGPRPEGDPLDATPEPKPCERCHRLEAMQAEIERMREEASRRNATRDLTPALIANPQQPRPANLQDRQAFKAKRTPREQAIIDKWRSSRSGA